VPRFFSGFMHLVYNGSIMDRVALAITLLVVAVCGIIVFLRVYYGNQPWSL